MNKLISASCYGNMYLLLLVHNPHSHTLALARSLRTHHAAPLQTLTHRHTKHTEHTFWWTVLTNYLLLATTKPTYANIYSECSLQISLINIPLSWKLNGMAIWQVPIASIELFSLSTLSSTPLSSSLVLHFTRTVLLLFNYLIHWNRIVLSRNFSITQEHLLCACWASCFLYIYI